ncbi:MAG TPA: DUF1501 domain-containing protein [Pirellulales bacterium]|jgi:hypothetical protein|nr:DUF1501 domain-containing protein [Pirellulales bacterium]
MTLNPRSPIHAAGCGCSGRLPVPVSRRDMLKASATGFAWTAFSALAQDRAVASSIAPSGPHFEPRAKSVIFMFMDGGVSHVDTFDPKPELTKRDGQPFATGAGRKWVKSPWKFAQHGQCGAWVSELFPHIATCVDDMAIIRSMKADLPIHSAGNLFLHSGHSQAGRPSIGSWVTYGLGTENQNLPGYVVLSFGHYPLGGSEVFASGFLPAAHEPTMLRSEGVPIENIVPADAPLQRAKLGLLASADRGFSARLGGSEAVESAIHNYELAARMQLLVPDVLDESGETKATRELYGLDDAESHARLYARQCLRARRLVEAGVRFVQINCPPGRASGVWDQHDGLKLHHEKNARHTDRAIAALIKDLKLRGLLDTTLIVWAGEFGRTPHAPKPDGRDHHPEGFSVFLAGGGVKGGTIHGATDEFGVHAVENVCDMHDLHATILHLLGLDHKRLTYRYSGRDYRLTDVHGRVIQGIIA